MQDSRIEIRNTDTSSSGDTPLGFVRRRRFAGHVLAFVMLTNTACYTYVPTMTAAPQPGEYVALDISDAGRSRLNEQLGGNVSRVEGLVNAHEGSEYLVSVTKVAYFNAPSANWTGERVRLSSEAIARVEQRKFSKGRTLLFVGGALVGIAAFVLTRTILGGGTEAAEEPPHLPPAGS